MKGQPTGSRVDTFAHRVRWARQHNTKLNKNQAARDVGINIFRLTNIENGHDTNVSKALLDRLARVFKTTPDWLRYGTERGNYFSVKSPPAEQNGQSKDETVMEASPEKIVAETPAPIETLPENPPPDPVFTTLAARLKAARLAIPNYTLSMLANATDLPLQHLQRLERGEEFSTPKPIVLARALKIDPLQILEVSLAGRVRTRRIETGLSPIDLASEIGIRARAIEAVEAGESQAPIYLNKLADALGVTPRWLTTGQEPKLAPQREPAPMPPGSTLPPQPFLPVTWTGEQLKAEREKRRMSYETLASRMGIGNGDTIARIESGEISSKAWRMRMANAMGLPITPPPQEATGEKIIAGLEDAVAHAKGDTAAAVVSDPAEPTQAPPASEPEPDAPEPVPEIPPVVEPEPAPPAASAERRFSRQLWTIDRIRVERMRQGLTQADLVLRMGKTPAGRYRDPSYISYLETHRGNPGPEITRLLMNALGVDTPPITTSPPHQYHYPELKNNPDAIRITPEIGQRLRDARLIRGHTAKTVGDHIGRTGWYVGNIERGAANYSDKLSQIADFLNVSLDYLLTGKEPPQEIKILARPEHERSTVSAEPEPPPPAAPEPHQPANVAATMKLYGQAQRTIEPVGDFDMRIEDDEFQVVFKQIAYGLSDGGEFGSAEVKNFAAVGMTPTMAKMFFAILSDAIGVYEETNGPINLPNRG